MNPEQIAQEWIQRCCETISEYDHAAHMDLISRDVQVLGVPGYEVITYADWYAQCEYEFSEKMIAETRYSALQLRESADDQITFLTNETVSTNDGTVDTHPVEIVLTREHDNRWRATRERLLDDSEARALGIEYVPKHGQATG